MDKIGKYSNSVDFETEVFKGVYWVPINSLGKSIYTTYIKHNGYYYFIDMMMYRNDSQEYLCEETGLVSDLLSSELFRIAFI